MRRLRDAVFDVIKRRVEKVALALPYGLADGFVAGPIDDRAEAFERPSQCRSARSRVCPGMGVEPVLEGIDGGHPGEETDDPFDSFRLARAASAGL